MILVLILQFLLSRHVTDISDDEEFAIHVTELPRLDDHFKQSTGVLILIFSLIQNDVTITLFLLHQIVLLAFPILAQHFTHT